MKLAKQFILFTGLFTFFGCEAAPSPAPVPSSLVMNQNSIDTLRESLLAGRNDLVLAGVSRVLPGDDFLSLESANIMDFPVGSWVSIIDSNRNTLAQGRVASIIDGEVHIGFATTGARRPQAGDAVVRFLDQR